MDSFSSSFELIFNIKVGSGGLDSIKQERSRLRLGIHLGYISPALYIILFPENPLFPPAIAIGCACIWANTDNNYWSDHFSYLCLDFVSLRIMVWIITYICVPHCPDFSSASNWMHEMIKLLIRRGWISDLISFLKDVASGAKIIAAFMLHSSTAKKLGLRI